MNKKRAIPTTVDAYIDGFPDFVQTILRKMQTTINRAAPDAEETISYGIPTLKLNGPLIYFAGFKTHTSIYPMTVTMQKQFKKELTPYLSGKGTAKFLLDQPIPYALIGSIVKFRVNEKRPSNGPNAVPLLRGSAKKTNSTFAKCLRRMTSGPSSCLS